MTYDDAVYINYVMSFYVYDGSYDFIFSYKVYPGLIVFIDMASYLPLL